MRVAVPVLFVQIGWICSLCGVLNALDTVPYLVTYVDKINSWWGAEAVAAALGVPGYANPTRYNVINLSFWLTSGPADAAALWANPLGYMNADNVFGSTNEEIQRCLTCPS
jgi:hypothetical protein